MPVDLSAYNTVAMRIAEFRQKHPEGSLQPVDHNNPFQVLDIAGKTYIGYTAAAYRHPDDPRPGIGVAWEPFPGKTPYTRDSELMNAETSAWGRAIVAVLAADTVAGIATREEIENRRADQESDAKPASSTRTSAPRTVQENVSVTVSGTLGKAEIEGLVKKIKDATTTDELNSVWKQAGALGALQHQHEGKTVQQHMYDRGDALKSAAGANGSPGRKAAAK